MHAIIDDGTGRYEIDMDRAIAYGIARVLHPLKAGDVYVHLSGDVNPLLLVEVTFSEEAAWQLIGFEGCRVHSDGFFRVVHNIQEIEKYLVEHEMVFDRNVNKEIDTLIHRR